MIELKNICFGYAKEQNVINDISLTLHKNEKVTIIGKSGCGKSTLLFLLAAIHRPNQGEILIDMDPLIDFRKGTSIIFQNNGLFPWKTVYQNLSLGLKVRNVPKAEIDIRINDVLEELDIKAYEHKFIKHLSGGQKQRVAIARSLVLDNDLFLFDEPSSSLDAMTKDQFQETLLKLYKTHPLTSILVTHDIYEAVYLGEKILIMNEGKIERVIINELYGKKDAKNTLDFYKKCIEIKGMLDL